MHLAANVAAGALELTDADRAEIEAVARKAAGTAKATSTNSSATATGRHGSIMKYNLNAEPA